MSLHTLLIVLTAARALPASDVGRLALWQVVAALLLLVVRPAIGDAWLLRATNNPEAHLPQALWAAIKLGGIGSFSVVAVGLVTGGAGLETTLWALVMVFLAMQDVLRVFCVKRGISWKPALMNAAAFSLSAVFVIVGASPVVVWPISTIVGALGLFVWLRVWPKRGEWFLKHGRRGRSFLGEMMIGSGLNQLLIVVLAWMVGIEHAGEVRIVQSILGVLALPLIGLSPVLLAYLTEQSGRRANVSRKAVALSVGLFGAELLGVLSLDWSLTVNFRGRPWGAWLIGADAWNNISGLLLPLGLSLAIGAAIIGAGAGVRVLGGTGRLNLVRLFLVIPQVVGFIFLAAHGVVPAAWGFVAVSAVTLCGYLSFFTPIRRGNA